MKIKKKIRLEGKGGMRERQGYGAIGNKKARAREKPTHTQLKKRGTHGKVGSICLEECQKFVLNHTHGKVQLCGFPPPHGWS